MFICYTPLMLKLLGQSEYGLYSLSNSVIGYLTLLSFGLGSAIVRYISIYRAKEEKENERGIFGLFLVIYSILALIVFAVGLVISFNVETIFHKGLLPEEIEKMSKLLKIMAFNTAISFPVSVFSSVVTAHERHFYRQIICIFSTIVTPCANLVALYLGYASVGIAVVNAALQSLMLPLYIVYCFKSIKVTPKFKKIPLKLLKEIIGFSGYVFLASIVDMLFWSTDKVILGMLANASAVAVYNIGATFNSMMIDISSAFSNVLTPRTTNMITKGATNDELTELFIRVGRLQYIVIALVLTGFVTFGRQFVNIWIGDGYGDSYWIAVLTLVPLSVPLIQNTGYSIVVAQNRHKFRSVVYFVIAIINVASTYIVVPKMGGLGAAICSSISYVIGQGIIMNLYYHFKIRLNIPLFWKNILKMSIIPIALMIVGLVITNYITINNWIVFFSAVGVYSVVYCVLMYFVVLNNYEKDVVRKPINKILSKIGVKTHV